MLVGIMTNFTKPTKLATITSVISKYNNIDIIYFTPKDVDVEKELISGKMYVNHEWRNMEREIPEFIDAVPYCFMKKNRKVINFLKQKTLLSDNRSNVLSKIQVQELLKNDPGFKHLVIPTYDVNNFEDIIKGLNRFGTTVLKPTNGIKGKGVYIISMEGEYFNVGHNKNTEIYSKKGLEDLYLSTMTQRKYILQKYVSSRSLQGDPFDCRVHVEKNSFGEWESANNYIRIGIGQKVISNVNQGGGISDLKPFLKQNYPEKWKSILKRIDDIVSTVPYKIEELRGTHIMSLGIDVGIDTDGALYLYEVNDGPATFAVLSQVATLRSGYYRFIYENILNNKLNGSGIHDRLNSNSAKKYLRLNNGNETKELNSDYNRLYKENQELQKEVMYYKKKYENIKESTSWKLSKPIRTIGRLKKRDK